MSASNRITVRSDDIDVNGHVHGSKYLDYAVHARWMALARAGLDVKELAEAGLGPVDLEITVTYTRELMLGDEIDVETRFAYPSAKVIEIRQSLVRRSDGALAAEVVSVTGLMDLRRRKLVENPVEVWSTYLRDLSVLGLSHVER